MDIQDILKTLNNLEQSLQNVESARQQVTNTVNAYEGARTQLHALVMEFAAVSTELKKVYTAIEENVSSIDDTLQNKVEEVFNDITSKAQELDDAARKIQSTFETACSQSAHSINDSVDNSMLKLDNEIDTTIVKFNKKATLEIESIATSLAAFKSAAQQMQENFSHTISDAAAKLKATQESIASDFGTSISEHISSFKALKSELQAIIDRYEEANRSLEAKIEQISCLIKTESGTIGSAIQNLHECHQAEHEDLLAKLKLLREGNIKAADNLSGRFNNVDTELGKLSSSISELQDRLDNASSLVIKTQKEAMIKIEEMLTGRIETLKEDLATSKKLTLICLIAIAISLLLNMIAFVR